MIRKLRLPGADQWLQYLTLAMSAFLIVYLVTYVSAERQRNDCREAVDRALITSVNERGRATAKEGQALDALVDGLLAAPGSPGQSQRLLSQFREARREAATIRTDNPIPSPTCEAP